MHTTQHTHLSECGVAQRRVQYVHKALAALHVGAAGNVSRHADPRLAIIGLHRNVKK